MKRIIVLYTDGHSREDGNVFYSSYVIVESDVLKFDEDLFSEDGTGLSDEEFINEAELLGYIVQQPEICNVPVREIL